MNYGYLFMIAGLLSFSALGMLLKVADTKRCRPSAVNALMYVWSLLFSLITVTLIRGASATAPASVFWIAIPFGVSASIAILAFQAGLRYGTIATSWLAVNLSAAIPTIASILIYHEPLGTRKTIALLMIPISIALLWIDKQRDERMASSAKESQ